MGLGLSGNLYVFLYVYKIKTAASCWLTADLILLFAEREALELILSQNIIKLQTTDNQV